MKKITICILSLVSAIESYSQQAPQTTPAVQTDYLAKSKSQKTTAFILLGVGAASLAIAAPGNVSFDLLPVLVIGGGIAAISSIPLFIASGRNKRKVKNATTYIKMETM